MSEQNTISAIEASNGTSYLLNDVSKSSVSVDNVHADVNLQHISREDYAQLIVDNNVLSNTLYIVSGDYIETYGQQIKNVAPGTELSDAVNYEQLQSGLNTKQPAGNYLTAIPNDYKTYVQTKTSLSSDGYATVAYISSKLSTLLQDKTMPNNPTQNQLADAVKQIWQLLGGGFS